MLFCAAALLAAPPLIQTPASPLQASDGAESPRVSGARGAMQRTVTALSDATANGRYEMQPLLDLQSKALDILNCISPSTGKGEAAARENERSANSALNLALRKMAATPAITAAASAKVAMDLLTDEELKGGAELPSSLRHAHQAVIVEAKNAQKEVLAMAMQQLQQGKPQTLKAERPAAVAPPSEEAQAKQLRRESAQTAQRQLTLERVHRRTQQRVADVAEAARTRAIEEHESKKELLKAESQAKAETISSALATTEEAMHMPHMPLKDARTLAVEEARKAEELAKQAEKEAEQAELALQSGSAEAIATILNPTADTSRSNATNAFKNATALFGEPAAPAENELAQDKRIEEQAAQAVIDAFKKVEAKEKGRWASMLADA